MGGRIKIQALVIPTLEPMLFPLYYYYLPSSTASINTRSFFEVGFLLGIKYFPPCKLFYLHDIFHKKAGGGELNWN
jgi:hypothetical protein